MRLGLTTMQLVKSPRAMRILAVVLFVLLGALPPTLLVVPWQQNVAATGRVAALDPLDRIQVIPAPVTGRLVALEVQEGAYVRENEVMAELARVWEGDESREGITAFLERRAPAWGKRGD